MSITLTAGEMRMIAVTFVDAPSGWRRRWEPDEGYAAVPDGAIEIGVQIVSVDKLRFFHKKTMNRETTIGAGVKFSFDGQPSLRADRVRSALFAYVPNRRLAPATQNSRICCHQFDQVTRVARLVRPIADIFRIWTQSDFVTTNFKSIGLYREIGVTAIVRSWLADPSTNHGLYVHPSPPDLSEYPQRSTLGSPASGNRKRRRHWVRRDQFRVGSGQYRFVCRSHVMPALIIET